MRLTARMSRKNRIFFAVLLASIASAGTLMATAPKHDPNVVEEKAWPVSTVAARVSTEAPQLHVFGRVETPNHASLSAAVEAQVQRLHVSEGDPVQEGQLLLTLDRTEEALRLEQRAADVQDSEAALATLQRQIATEREVLEHMRELYQLTRSKAERLRKLNSQSLVATERLEDTLQEVARQGIELTRQQALVDNHPNRLAQSEAAVQRSRALWQNQRLMLQRTEVRAPFDGRISSLSVSPGDRVRPGQALLSLYDTGALQVRVPLPRTALAQLRDALARGERITARLGESALPAELQQLAGEVRSGSSGIDGIFRLVHGSDQLDLGRAVDVSIELPSLDNAIALPALSLYDNRRIYVVQDERLVGHEVIPLGQRVTPEGDLEVLVRADGLRSGDAVLSTNLPRATTGLRVQVINGTLAGIATGDGTEVML